MIYVGALIYDDVRKVFGLVTELLDESANTWYIDWNDGRQSWIFASDLYKFIESAERIKDESLGIY